MKPPSFRPPKNGRKNTSLAGCEQVTEKRTAEARVGLQRSNSFQFGRRKLIVKDEQSDSDRTIHLTDSWFNTSARNLMVDTSVVVSPPLRKTHSRNASEDTTASSISASSVDDARLQAAREFGLMLAKNKRLPTVCPGFVSSNHVLVNQERTTMHLPALTRRIELDELAREFAQAMAKSGKLQRCDPLDLDDGFQLCDTFGVNVACGPSVQEIHDKMLQNPSERNKMVDRRYSQMGMGTAKGKNGKLYLCQIFKG